MKKAEEILRDRLDLADPGLIGCTRRNLWEDQETTPWRHVRGNSLLYTLGERHGVETPAGLLEFFLLHERWLLQFRGGQWNTYWTEDFMDLWSLVHQCGQFENLSPSVVVLHENRGELSVVQVDMPDSLDPAERARYLLAQHANDPPGRISKAGARAMRVCRYCPVRRRCNAQDELRGDTQDWSPAYREELS